MKLKRGEMNRNDLSLPPTPKERNYGNYAILLILIVLSFLYIIPASFDILYHKFYKKEAIYIPDYHTLRNNLTMPDGRKQWDNNNQTDMLIAAQVLENAMNITEKNITLKEFIEIANKRDTYPSGGGGGGHG